MDVKQMSAVIQAVEAKRPATAAELRQVVDEALSPWDASEFFFKLTLADLVRMLGTLTVADLLTLLEDGE